MGHDCYQLWNWRGRKACVMPRLWFPLFLRVWLCGDSASTQHKFLRHRCAYRSCWAVLTEVYWVTGDKVAQCYRRKQAVLSAPRRQVNMSTAPWPATTLQSMHDKVTLTPSPSAPRFYADEDGLDSNGRPHASFVPLAQGSGDCANTLCEPRRFVRRLRSRARPQSHLHRMFWEGHYSWHPNASPRTGILVHLFSTKRRTWDFARAQARHSVAN